MGLARSQARLPFRCTTFALTFLLIFTAAVPALSQTDEDGQATPDESVYLKWEQISSLRSQGQFTAAIAVLHEILDDPQASDEVLQRAYNDLVFTYYLERDVEGAREQARVALERFPSLTADPVAFPPRVNETYDQLRREMFGSVTVTKPDEAQVFLDEDLRGETPLLMDLLPVGSHSLKLVKSGYHDYTESIVVDPNGRHVYEISMDRDRGAGWWLARGAVVVGAGVLIAVLANGGGDEEQAALGSPPPPPR
jgi:hypothetical protein